MKIYIILALIALTSATEWKLKTRKEWDDIEDACVERYKTLVEKLENAKADKYPPKAAFELLLCVFREAGVWSDTDGFSIDRLMMVMERVATKENINKKLLRNSLETCSDNNSEGSAPLDWAYRFHTCIKNNELVYETLKKARFQEIQEE